MAAPIASMNTVRDWAKERLQSGMEPPWSFYRLMQAVDAIDNLQAMMAATQPPAGSPGSEPYRDAPDQSSAAVHQLNTAPRHPEGVPVPLPMFGEDHDSRETWDPFRGS